MSIGHSPGAQVPSGRQGTEAGNPATGRRRLVQGPEVPVSGPGNGRPPPVPGARHPFQAAGPEIHNADPVASPDISGPFRTPRFAGRIAASTKGPAGFAGVYDILLRDRGG